MRRQSNRGFTLVELLVVIGIIAVLVGILLPSLQKARESANAIKCSSNLRSIGQGLNIYLAENKGVYPAAYDYVGTTFSGSPGFASNQAPNSAVDGYVHWSSYLYKKGGNQTQLLTDPNSKGSIYFNLSGWDMFQCPSFPNGGLPPTNTFPGNDASPPTKNEANNVMDQMAPRMAYTVNEAIMPRNKWQPNFQGGFRGYRFVRASQVKNGSGTILATEFNTSWQVVSEAANDGSGTDVCKSHRPVHGFKSTAGVLDLNQVPPNSFGRKFLNIIPVVASDLNPNLKPAEGSQSRLDWVGRIHGRGQPKDKRTNFLFVDGHCETKKLEETIQPFQWGQTLYSLAPNDDVKPAY